jgi:hypothetical protein
MLFALCGSILAHIAGFDGASMGAGYQRQSQCDSID